MARVEGPLGRVAWFLTFDADHHMRHFNGPSGIAVLNGAGELLPEVRRVLSVCARHKLVVCTGRLSATEALAIVHGAHEAGCDRISVTHAMMEVPAFSVDQMKEAAALGAKLEIAALALLMGPDAHVPWMREWRRVTPREVAAVIGAVGPQHLCLSADLGPMGNPIPADGCGVARRCARHGGDHGRRDSRDGPRGAWRALARMTPAIAGECWIILHRRDILTRK